MALAETFKQVVDSLPDDWTDLELDLRIHDERRYIDAAVYLTACQRAELLPPPRGLALAADRGAPLRPRRGARGGPGRHWGCSTTPASPASWARVRARGAGRGRPWWGRPESVRRDFRRLRAQ